MNSIIFKATNINIKWNDKTAISDATFNFSADKQPLAVPVMGESGNGKSSLLYVLSALKKPESGSFKWKFPNGKVLTFDGKKIDYSHKELKKNLYINYFGYSSQNSALLPFFTVAENLKFPLQINCSKINSDQRLNSICEHLLGKSEIEILYKYPHKLSEGQRQRISLMQSIINDPYVLFADEPTGNLDPYNSEKAMNIIKKWLNGSLYETESKCRMLFWVTHNPLELLYFKEYNDNLIFVEKKKCSQIKIEDLKGKWKASIL